MSGANEEPLPLYGLPDDWPGERCLGAHDVDVWEGHHVAENDDLVVVHIQRRAIHGGTHPGSPRVTGPEHLIRFDAAFEAMLRADQAMVSAREASRLAHRAYDLATIAYRAGASTNIEVLDAARAARDADTAAAQAEDISRQARLDLLVASGRFP